MSATSTIQAKVSPHIDTSAVTDSAAKAVKPMLTGSVLRPSTSGSAAPPALPLFQRLLARYLNNLAVKPLKTKAVTSGILFFLQEVIAARASGSPKEDWPAKNSNLRRVAPPQLLGLLSQLGVSSKAIQMSAYGGLVSAPLAHFFVGFFQKMFAGRTGALARLGQIAAMMSIQTPVMAVVYITSMAIINGARSAETVIRTVKMGLPTVLKSMWITSPLSIAFAQTFLPAETWVIWFNFVSFVVGTFMTTQIKRRALQAKAQAKREGKSGE
ncbi:hypothetical protein FFLO_06920 [Filobasidium floriforme]|uniref:Uncharacterized protein n=1 Tax=Filobasidium floriforme TaxID=5210 RepID=A0A8K0NLN4_9TREE|nr:hypothetical protein FFLO_06920 [Filobasidium floriforme]